MAITVKHKFVSAIPDSTDATIVRPSNWNDDHDLTGTIPVENGGTGASTLTGYVKGNGTSAMTASATIPSGDVTGLGTMSTQNANAVAITGGTINGTTIGATTASTGAFTTATASTSLTTPIVQASNSAGLALKNSAGTTQISMGAGGGDNITVSAPIAINPANALVNISPTGTGTVTINPATAGTINNTVIGGTTPAAGTFTTITGQTGRLNGTGQNLIAYSNNFVTGWSNGAITVTGSQSDPVGGSTASLLVPTVTNTAHYLANSTAAFSSGTTFTISVYVKASGYTLFYINDATAGTFACSYNLTAVTATPNTGCTGTITAVTGATGWYRLTLTTTGTPTSSSRATITPYASGATLTAFGATFAGDGTSGAFVYGTQVEFGSVANTYIPTTTTAVYGTPTLSFSGVSEIGLLSNGALYLQPAGTGALQAQATTSSTVGGNARGANAVDWQTSRGSASQVSSGSLSVIGGGFQNTASGSQASVVGGSTNVSSGLFALIGGGSSNTVSGERSAIVGGTSNTSAGYFNLIGGGFTNSGTSGSAVTTQSGTMNATTAVTLSGSNANIKVGQYITGTSIANHTYVAAISGTSLTLSQAASGSSTSTLSFYTPHGVVVGGGNNQATGSYSFIGGGGDAGTAANRNVASGDWSFVGGGSKNSASNNYATIVGGQQNSTFNVYATVVGGILNQSQAYAFVGGGFSNQANGNSSVVSGGQFGVARSIGGYVASPASLNPMGTNSQGTQQSGLLVLARQTTDATATVLTSDTSAASGTNQVILPNNSAYFFTGEVVSGVTGGGDTKGWSIEGVIKRGANAGTTALVGIPTVTSTYADVGAATWDIAVTADTTNGGIRVTFTGQLATTIRTVCRINTVEMTF